jgi:hypothetical protein
MEKKRKMIKALLLLDLLSEDDEEQIKPRKRIHWVRPWIVRKEKRDALMRLSIKADERLAVTLRYLATGETFKLLQYCFRMSRTTISYVVSECCDALFKILGPDFLKTPDSEEEWCAIAKHFTQW